jgi:hypothetical protein
MTTREQRLAQFTTDTRPPVDLAVELLCEDHRGTYLLPFPCLWSDGSWRNAETGEAIAPAVLGWRVQGGIQK